MYRDSNDVIEDSFQAFLVEGAKFTKIEEYPIIPRRMIAKDPPKKIMPFNIALNYHGDLSDVFICTYARDTTFERVRRNPKKYINFFKRCAGIIGFDFSVHSDMPIYKQKSQMGDNQSYTFFFGNNNSLVIPNIRCGSDELLEEYLSSFPKHTLIAVGTHGFIQKKEEKAEWFCFLEKITQILEPSGIIVYGNLNGRIFDSLKEKYKFYFYEPWITSDRKKRGGDL